MGRLINNGKNFIATVTSTGLVVSADRITAAGSPSAPAIDALLERGLVPAIRRTAGKPRSVQT
jgi:hypothetical protein